MAETLGYTDDEHEEPDEFTSSQWQLEHTLSETSNSLELARYFQYLNYHLHLIQKVETPLERRIIPATSTQRLAFYRSYAASPNKIRAMSTGYQSNSFFWLYIFTVIFKILPHTYIQTFLAAYAPKNHLYLHKMSPIFFGSKYVILIVSFFEILFYSKNMMLLLECAIVSIFWKNPWNRCPPNGYTYLDLNKTISCYTLDDLQIKFRNETIYFDPQASSYVTANGEVFHIAQMGYIAYRMHKMSGILKDLYCVFALTLVSVLSPLMFKPRFWKILNGAHMIMFFGELFTYLYMFLFNVQRNFKVLNVEQIPPPQISPVTMHADVDMLLETELAPPIIHVLSARSLQEIFPTRDSSMITLSNTIYYLFRGLLTHKLKLHCESLMLLPLYAQATAYMGWIFLWPIYLSTFTTGDLLTIIFFNLQLVIELSNLLVIFDCLVEIIISEWEFLNRCVVSTLLVVIGVIINYTLSEQNISAMSIFGKLIVIIMECLVLSFLYPLPRFIDDITFYYGTPPYKLRILSLKLIPVISGIILFICIKVIVSKASWSKMNEVELEQHLWLLPLLILPLLLGFVYIYFKWSIKEKKGWKNLFVPDSDWGPQDYTLKEIRKDYDSSVYIASQAPRHISRYMISKAECKSYKLDLCYTSGRATIPVSEFRRNSYFKHHY